MALDLDPRFTFDAFVVGPANRLAVAASRRVADVPGSTYNPLFLYSGSGLGKTHLITAIGHQLRRVHDAAVRFESLEHLLEQISEAVEAGERDAFRDRIQDVEVLLLDDVQFLEGQRQAQEELIAAWDAISARGGQVVLTSDRPPHEIDQIDERLLARLSGGLIVDIGVPDFETRVAIARRKADERGQSLDAEVYQALARIAFSNVRELQGALNRLIAVQELEQRAVGPDEVTRLLGTAADRGQDEFGEFLSDISGTVDAVVDEADQRVADAILAWEGEGFRTRRLDAALSGSLTAPQAEALVRRFEQDAGRLKIIESELRSLDPGARELSSAVLRDPDRVVEAEALLAQARERKKPPPGPPGGITLDALDPRALAVRAAAAIVDAPGAAYNPLFVLGPEGVGKSALLAALGNELRDVHGQLVAYVTAAAFDAELIDALEHSRLDIWRERYRRAGALLVDDLDGFAGGDRAEEELFHLFEDFYRDGRQMVFAATLPPHDLPLPARLRSRLESGLVVELDAPIVAPAGSSPEPTGAGDEPPGQDARPLAPPEAAGAGAAVVAGADGSGAGAVPAAAPESAADPGARWILSRERVLWEWPYPQDWIEESLD